MPRRGVCLGQCLLGIRRTSNLDEIDRFGRKKSRPEGRLFSSKKLDYFAGSAAGAAGAAGAASAAGAAGAAGAASAAGAAGAASIAGVVVIVVSSFFEQAVKAIANRDASSRDFVMIIFQ